VAQAVNDGRIDLVFRSIAVDRGPGRPCNDRAAAALERAPHKTIDERILESGEGRLSGACKSDQPIGIFAPRMRHGEQHREVPARLMNEWGGEFAHGRRVNFRASLGLAEGACNAREHYSLLEKRILAEHRVLMARILLAEDDTSMREYLQRALQRVGYEVEAVGCGTEAMPLLEAQHFDLLLTDIVMPEMDGIELAQKASALDPAIRVMFITGFAAVALQGGRTAPEAKLLSKPFHLKDLVMEVDRMFQTEDQHGRL